jgi:hypothetical protein
MNVLSEKLEQLRIVSDYRLQDQTLIPGKGKRLSSSLEVP